MASVYMKWLETSPRDYDLGILLLTLGKIQRVKEAIARELRKLQIHFDLQKCKGVWQCYEVCPVGCWTPDYQQRVAIFHNPERCSARRAPSN